MEKSTVFVDEQVQELIAKTKTYKNNDDISDTRKKTAVLGRRRKNLKFEGIPKTCALSEEDAVIQRGEVSTENTKAILTEFLEKVLGIDDAQSIEYSKRTPNG